MNDAAYYGRRADQERDAAAKATCGAARIAHQTMAVRYVALATGARTVRIAA
jgi:hypothetical protein